jgi:hypothetical protein
MGGERLLTLERPPTLPATGGTPLRARHSSGTIPASPCAFEQNAHPSSYTDKRRIVSLFTIGSSSGSVGINVEMTTAVSVNWWAGAGGRVTGVGGTPVYSPCSWEGSVGTGGPRATDGLANVRGCVASVPNELMVDGPCLLRSNLGSFSGSIQRKDGEGTRLVAQPLSLNLLLSDRFLIAKTMPPRKIRITATTIPTMAPVGKAGPEVEAMSLLLPLLVITETEGVGASAEVVICSLVKDGEFEGVSKTVGLATGVETEDVEIKVGGRVEDKESDRVARGDVATGLDVAGGRMTVTVNVNGPGILLSPEVAPASTGGS